MIQKKKNNAQQDRILLHNIKKHIQDINKQNKVYSPIRKKTPQASVFLQSSSGLDSKVWINNIFFFEKNSKSLKFITQSNDGMFNIEIPNIGIIAQASDIKIAALVVSLYLTYKKGNSDISLTNIVNKYIEMNSS